MLSMPTNSPQTRATSIGGCGVGELKLQLVHFIWIFFHHITHNCNQPRMLLDEINIESFVIGREYHIIGIW